jgi:hypothetical protein
MLPPYLYLPIAPRVDDSADRFVFSSCFMRFLANVARRRTVWVVDWFSVANVIPLACEALTVRVLIASLIQARRRAAVKPPPKRQRSLPSRFAGSRAGRRNVLFGHAPRSAARLDVLAAPEYGLHQLEAIPLR